jgi:hypothetical protein
MKADSSIMPRHCLLTARRTGMSRRSVLRCTRVKRQPIAAFNACRRAGFTCCSHGKRSSTSGEKKGDSTPTLTQFISITGWQ